MKKFTKVVAALSVAAILASGCSKSTNTGSSNGPATYKAGTYTATSQGNNGEVKVEVVFTDDKIDSITIVEHQETPGLGDAAMEKLISDILDKQSADVDVVSGATNSSNALINAVKDCMNQAKGN
ncbi:MAG TPA: FMN-binding protein [Tissierellaceae bacterium]